jgi:hypothetical protein
MRIRSEVAQTSDDRRILVVYHPDSRFISIVALVF